MPSLANAADRRAIESRFGRLASDTKGLWGVMTAPQMLAHCADSLRMALGDLPVKRKNIALFRHFPLKHLVIYVLPFPKSAPTAPELKTRTPKPFDDEGADIRALLARLDPATGSTRAKEHPIFGSMTPEQWGALGYRHLDHHLRQFGV